MALRYLLCGLLGCAVLAGCSSQDTRDLSQDTRNLAVDTAHAVSGAGKVAEVNAALALTKIDISGIHVDANGSVVTLGGHVRNANDRAVAIQTASGVRGVQQVIDHLRVAAQ